MDGVDALELAGHLDAVGRRVLHGPVATDAGAGWPDARPITCVEIVKRLLGVRAPAVVTPHQLYRHLLREDRAEAGFVEVGSYDYIQIRRLTLAYNRDISWTSLRLGTAGAQRSGAPIVCTAPP